jgi:surface antigen
MKTFAALSLALALAACAQTTNPQPEVTEQKPVPLIKTPIDDGGSGIVGPGGGALLGGAFGAGGGAKASILAGLAIGYALGGSNGPTLSGLPASEQRRAMGQVMNVPLGTSVRWRTAAEQASGEITPLREFRDGEGRRCRDFTETRVVRASHGQVNGTACLPG